MADFGGFQVKTPQEVLQELQAQRQAISMIPDRQAADRANIVFQLSNAFGNPELKKAQRVEKNIQEAQARLKKSPDYKDDGSLINKKRELEAMFNAVKADDPAAAAQISSLLTEIESTQVERERLRSTDRRAERASQNQATESQLRQEAANRKLTLDDRVYVETYDPKTGRKLKTEHFGWDERDQWEAAASEPNTIVKARNEVSFTDGTLKMGNFSPNGSNVATDRDMLIANTSALEKGSRVIEVLTGDPAAATGVAGLLNVTTELSNELRQGIRILKEGQAPLPSVNGVQGTEWLTPQQAKDKIDGILASAEGFGEVHARNKESYNALTLNMAYALARSLDPSGRLSDADVQFAAQMIARARGNPRTITRVLAETLVPTYNQARSFTEGYNAPGINPGIREWLAPTAQRHQEAYDKFKGLALALPGLPKEEMYPIFGMEVPSTPDGFTPAQTPEGAVPGEAPF